MGRQIQRVPLDFQDGDPVAPAACEVAE